MLGLNLFTNNECPELDLLSRLISGLNGAEIDMTLDFKHTEKHMIIFVSHGCGNAKCPIKGDHNYAFEIHKVSGEVKLLEEYTNGVDWEGFRKVKREWEVTKNQDPTQN